MQIKEKWEMPDLCFLLNQEITKRERYMKIIYCIVLNLCLTLWKYNSNRHLLYLILNGTFIQWLMFSYRTYLKQLNFILWFHPVLMLLQSMNYAYLHQRLRFIRFPHLYVASILLYPFFTGILWESFCWLCLGYTLCFLFGYTWVILI